MESGDDGLESEANVRPRPRLTGAGQPRGCPAARWTAIDRGLSRDPLAQARLNRSAKGAGTGHSPRYPKSGTTQSDRLLEFGESGLGQPNQAELERNPALLQRILHRGIVIGSPSQILGNELGFLLSG